MMNAGEEVFQLPSCWQDDVRMNSLFAPFRARSINPTDWDSKMSFWDSLIEQWCLYHKAPLVDPSVLANHFRRKDKVPSCLPEVVQHLLRNKTLTSKDNFYQMTEQSWKNWAVKIMIINPLQWTLGRVKSTISRSSEKPENVFVHLPSLKKLGQEVMEKIPENQKGKLLEIGYVQEISQIKSTEALELVLRWLDNQKMVAVHQHHTNVLIKFPKKENPNLAVTEIDKAFYSLETNKKMLENNLNRLELERDNLLEEARKNVSAKKMAVAKTCLRRKKGVENVINKLRDGIENIESLIYEMQMAEMANVILDCYQTGVTSLNRYFKENGLTKDRAVNARNEVEEVLIYASDIDSALSESISGPITDESNEDLEEELKNLLQSNIEESNKDTNNLADDNSVLDRLPQVPSASPKASIDEKLEKQFATLAI